MYLLLWLKILQKREIKKITESEQIELQHIEEACYKAMESSVNYVNWQFSPLKKSSSPSVANVQIHMDIFEKRNSNYTKLPSAGFINYNLCLNA